MQGPGIHWKFVVITVGYIILIEALFLFLSAGVAYYYHGSDVPSMLLSAGIAFVFGWVCVLSMGVRSKITFIGKKEGYITVALSWILFSFFGAFPFYFSGVTPDFTDAFFESASGLTTTGATILTDIDIAPKGILFWRSLLQWLGGMGIIVFSLALLPLLGGEAAQLFDAESTGLTHDKFRPRVSQMAKRLWGMYILFTLIVVVLLSLGPMGWYDAVCHGFTTISTGGFSTKDASISYWNSVYTESVVIIFMMLGAINFTLLYFLFFKAKIKQFFQDEELRWFLAIILISTFLIAVGLFFQKHHGFLHSFRTAFFQVVSIITTTGFSTEGFSYWGAFYLIVFLFLMIVCGCAGSTSGGLKVVRAVGLVKSTMSEFQRLLHPRAIIPVRLNGKAISFSVVQRLLAFAFLYISIIFVSCGVLTFVGIPFVESLGACVTAMSNVGPGFGTLEVTFVSIPIFAKWYLSFLMIVGRLEIFTILILFTPEFWRR
ncbi:potassium transporter [Bacteroidia bacterium]|nr:potassium transporter [Bacteroidia bacterium]